MILVNLAFFILLFYWLQGFVYRRFAMKKLDFDLAFSQNECTEGDTLYLREDLRNQKLLPLPLVSAKFRMDRALEFEDGRQTSVTDSYYQSDLFSVAPYQHITRRLPFKAARRGFYQIKNMDISTNDLLYQHNIVQAYTCSSSLLVLPALLPYNDQSFLFRQLYGDITVRRFTNPDPFAFRGIRQYQPQDSLRNINFKASAQTGSLMVNIHEATASQQVCILLNLEAYKAWEREDVYEEAIRIAASAADYFTRLGITVSLYSNGADTTTHQPVAERAGGGAAHGHALRRQLARIDLGRQRAAFSLPPLSDGCAYLLVSPNHDETIQAAYRRLELEGMAASWIIPRMGFDTVTVPESATISHWEVNVLAGKAKMDQNLAG